MTSSNQSRETPKVTFDLRFYPPALNQAYWNDPVRNVKLKHWDSQVALFWSCVVVALHINYATKQGMDHIRLLSVFSVATGFLSVWLLLLYVAPKHVYTRYRLVIVSIVRFLIGWTAHQTTADTRDMLHTTMIYQDTFLTYALKICLITPPPMMLIEANVLQLPYLWQAAAVLYKSGNMMFGAMAVAFVQWANTPAYLSAADQLNSTWAALVQQTGAIAMPQQHPRLAGRSTAVLLSWCLMYITETAAILWAVYLFQWLELRAWLRRKLVEGVDNRNWRAASLDRVIFISGVAVSVEQLANMHFTKASSILLEPTGGVGGVLLLVCLHVFILSVICYVSLIASQGLVLHVLPAVLPSDLFDQFYPLGPAV